MTHPHFFILKTSLLLFFFCATSTSYLAATNNLRIPDSRSLSMGGNGAAHAPLFNPALLALRTQKELRMDYYNRYSMKELATLSSGFCFPNHRLPVGFHLASFGYDQYRESLFRLSAGKRLNTCWALGVSMQYALLQSELFETNASRISADAGIAFCPTEEWLITASIINFPSASLRNAEVDTQRMTEYLMEINANWQMIDNLLITGGAAHGHEVPFAASVGIEYLCYEDFLLRTGLRTTPLQPSLGVGYRFSIWTTDVMTSYHPVLGTCIGMGLSYAF
jgi:hypothetical protein